MEGNPILAIKKSITPRNGPTRIIASEIHLLAGVFFCSPNRTRGGLEGLLSSGSNRFGKSVATPESEEVLAAAVISFISVVLLTPS
jgi:hypothetical protein